MNTFLSFCIPTFNRSKNIEFAINSIITAIKNFTNNENYKFEIIISDNNSDDNTYNVVNEFVNLKGNIDVKYFLNEVNIGPSRNLIKSAQYATGKYIWFFSDDDCLLSNAVENVMANLAFEKYSFNFATRILVDSNYKRIDDILPQPKTAILNPCFKSGIELFSELGLEITTIIGFFSSIIIRRNKWEEGVRTVKEIDEFGYLKVLLEAIKIYPSIITTTPCVLCRLDYRGFKGNNSFVWLDNYIESFIYAYHAGYDLGICQMMIKHILSLHSKLFVIDKALGYRKSNLFKLFKYLKNYNVNYFNFWFFISLIPSFLLKNTYRLLKIIF